MVFTLDCGRGTGSLGGVTRTALGGSMAVDVKKFPATAPNQFALNCLGAAPGFNANQARAIVMRETANGQATRERFTSLCIERPSVTREKQEVTVTALPLNRQDRLGASPLMSQQTENWAKRLGVVGLEISLIGNSDHFF